MGMPQNVFIKSIRLEQDEMPDGELDLRTNPKGTPVTLVLSTNGAEISGVVERGDAPAADTGVCATPDRENARCERGTITGADGSYTIRGLSPGRYRLSAGGPKRRQPRRSGRGAGRRKGHARPEVAG